MFELRSVTVYQFKYGNKKIRRNHFLIIQQQSTLKADCSPEEINFFLHRQTKIVSFISMKRLDVCGESILSTFSQVMVPNYRIQVLLISRKFQFLSSKIGPHLQHKFLMKKILSFLNSKFFFTLIFMLMYLDLNLGIRIHVHIQLVQVYKV